MSVYFIKRLAATIPALIGVSLVCFFLVQLTPGGPVEQTLAEWRHSGIGAEGVSSRMQQITEEQRLALIAYYGFDKPIHVRYFQWIVNLFCLDLGESYFYSTPVWDIIKKRLPVSISFGLLSFFATYIVCIPLGIVKAAKNGGRFDMFSSAVIFFFYSIPSFAFAILLVVIFCGGSFWNLFPIEGMISENFDELSLFHKITDYIYHMFLPITCYTIGGFASLTMLMKDSLLEQLSCDYMLTARAKGLTQKQAIIKHALRNALLPIASGLGHWVSLFFAGSLLIETIFGLEGIGMLSYESIIRRDYPIVLSIIMILSVLHILGNLLSDFLYVAIDPRIDYQ